MVARESTKCTIFYGRLVRTMAVIAGAMQMAVGVFHLKESLEKPFCEDNIQPYYEAKYGNSTIACHSPWVAWIIASNDELSWTDDVNGGKSDYEGDKPHVWREVFSFQPDLFIDRWTPVFFGLLSLTVHFGQTRWEKITDNWIRFGFWFLLQALWGSFGYAGNLGIFSGFISAQTALLAIFAGCFSPNEPRTMNLLPNKKAEKQRKSGT